MTVEQKLQKWIDKNPNGYLEKNQETIAQECDISAMSVSRHLNKLIAKRDDCLPSDVEVLRKTAGFGRGSKKLSEAEIKKIHDYETQGYKLKDISYLTGYDERTVKKYLQQAK